MENFKLSPLIIKLICLYLLLPIFYLSLQIYQRNTFSTHFVDEEDNFVTGYYLQSGEKLYENIFSHHQPLTFVLSASIQKLTSPGSLFTLVKRHHDALIFWSLAWCLFLFYRFGFNGVLFASIFEISKIFLLGNLFLAEALVVYPLVYLTFIALDCKRVRFRELVFIGLCISFIFLQLLPLWPLLFYLLLIVLYGQREYLAKSVFFVVLGFCPLLLVCLKYFSLSEYFYQVFYINLKYYIPLQATSPTSNLISSLIAPVTSIFIYSSNQTLWIEKMVSLGLLIGLIILLKAGKFRLVFLIVSLLMLANLRYVSPGKQYYEGFHLLPWYSLLITSFAFVFLRIITIVKKLAYKIMIVLGLVAIVGCGWLSVDVNSFFGRNRDSDYYVNFSRQFDIGQAVSILKKSGDSLFVLPIEPLVYWQAKIEHASMLVYYYQWMDKVPEFNSLVLKMFKESPPTFIYIDPTDSNPKSDRFDYFNSQFDRSKYIEIKKDNFKTGLFVLKSRIKLLDKKQLEDLEYYRFTIN